MKLILLSPGATKSPFWRDAEDFYRKKIAHYLPVELDYIKDEPLREGKNEAQMVAAESDRMLARLAQGGERRYMVCLDLTGRQMDSPGLARLIQKTASGSYKEMVFVVGGVLGCSAGLKAKANCVLSLSAMTFTHELSRVILLEQLYRALTILKGEKYHK
jgi:23S rRNA (pseudouridine1915-N3)-methyltransferase